MAKVTSLICGLILILGLVYSVNATNYVVGGTQGWTVSTGLKTWLKGKEFVVGDMLLFQYPSGFGVKEVSEQEYKECDVGKSLHSFSASSTTIILQTPGKKYFVSTTQEICKKGLKLAINVKLEKSSQGVAMSPKSSQGIAMSPTSSQGVAMSPKKCN